MATIDNITVAAFKTQFNRDFPYLPVWNDEKTYFVNDEVFYTPNFYVSKVDNNTATPTDGDNWKVKNDNADNYISDADILRAFGEAKVNFNPNFFGTNETAEMVFYYLAAHYLVIDLNNALNPLAVGFSSFTQSKSVGSVSESYGVPSWILNDSKYGMYALTGYGRKYLSLILPFLTGNIIFTPGKITYD